MAKKNPFVFTIGFNKSNPTHVQVTEILNNTEEKAQLIATAILFYLEQKKESGGVNLEAADLQPAIAEIIQREMKKALDTCLKSQAPCNNNPLKGNEHISLDEEPVILDSETAQNAKNALRAFRRF